MSDSSSLQNLNDIVVPATVAWWPLAPAWYLLAVVTLFFTLWMCWRRWRQWKTDQYRREALKSLHSLRVVADRQALQQIPGLIKRAALSCWPRADVAALSGRQWHEFLDRSSATNQFCAGVGSILDRLAYTDAKADAKIDGDSLAASQRESDSAFSAAEFWLKHHRKELADG